MGLATLYAEKKSALAPPPAQGTYEQFVFKMEKDGVNNLVAKADEDSAFTAAPNLGTYAQTTFALERAGANRLLAEFQSTPYRTPAVPESYIAGLFARGDISQL